VEKKYGVTIHYNGPPVRSKDLDQLFIDARYHIGKDWGGGARVNGIQYEYAVGHDGAQYRLRNPRSFLWHAGHPNANQWAYSVTFLIGDGQRITIAARDSMAELCRRLMAADGFGRERIKGHKDWSPSACPGSAYYDFVLPFAGGKLSAPLPSKLTPPKLESPDYTYRLVVASGTDLEEMQLLEKAAEQKGYKDAWLSKVKVH
jgi:hypothetical protein